MRVITVQAEGPGRWTLGFVGAYSQVYSPVLLTEAELGRVRVLPAAPTFRGDPAALKLGLDAYTIGIAYEFDPYFGLSVSRVDPLPHQLEAVYENLLKLPQVRFLLADDAGAGKTIMAGLLIGAKSLCR
jgi:hypothetical protein